MALHWQGSAATKRTGSDFQRRLDLSGPLADRAHRYAKKLLQVGVEEAGHAYLGRIPEGKLDAPRLGGLRLKVPVEPRPSASQVRRKADGGPLVPLNQHVPAREIGADGDDHL